MIRSHVLMCGGTGCTSSNSLKIQATGSNVSKEMTVSNLTAGQTVAMDFGETLRGKITFQRC